MKPEMQYVGYDKQGKPLHLFLINNTRIVANNEWEAKEIYKQNKLGEES